jgi:hypothetical protein
VDVRGDGGDGASFATGRFGIPGSVRQIFEEVLVDSLVDRVGFEERLLQIKDWITLAPEAGRTVENPPQGKAG